MKRNMFISVQQPQKEMIVCRYGEIFLKGNNRKDFEQALASNIRTALQTNAVQGKVIVIRNRILIDTQDPCTFLKRIFGIVSFSCAVKFPLDLKIISEFIIEQLKIKKFITFRISTQRLTKSTPLTSIDVDKQVGAQVVEALNKKVSLKHPDIDVGIEIIGKDAYVFFEITQGPGGLPIPCSGTVLALLDGSESDLAAILMMKRGCSIIGLVKDSNKHELLQKFSPNQIEMQQIESISQISKIAKEKNMISIVASQELNIPNLLTLNPLVAFSKEEIGKRLKCYEDLY